MIEEESDCVVCGEALLKEDTTDIHEECQDDDIEQENCPICDGNGCLDDSTLCTHCEGSGMVEC